MGKYQKPTGFWRGLALGWRGLAYAWRTQGHIRFHVFAGIAALVAGWFARLSGLEWLILIMAIGAVIAAEVMNTAIEFAVDLVQPKFNPIAGISKDVAAGAVLVTAIQAVVVGLFLFGPPLWRWLRATF